MFVKFGKHLLADSWRMTLINILKRDHTVQNIDVRSYPDIAVRTVVNFGSIRELEICQHSRSVCVFTRLVFFIQPIGSDCTFRMKFARDL